MSEVENLHQLVQKPREQVADAEALLDIANALVSSARSQSNAGIVPSDFVNCLLRDFGQQTGGGSSTIQNSIHWKDLGMAVSHIFKRVPGCYTMLGPMNTEVKLRKPAVRRKHTTQPIESSRPEELNDTEVEAKTDTDKNMSVMFEILRRKKLVALECLILNRKSLAQTVENLFALSFLEGSHIVSPRNALAASSVVSGELMLDYVPVGEELMPHRIPSGIPKFSQAELIPNSVQLPAATMSNDPESSLATTPIRKLTRNRGLVTQEAVIEDTTVYNNGNCKRRRRLM